MTLKHMFGFDDIVDTPDLRLQGWTSPVATALFSPTLTSENGRPGKYLRLHTTGPNSTAPGTSGTGDWGVFNTGMTVKSVWDAGGAVLGANVRLNSTVTDYYGSFGTTSSARAFNSQFLFDGQYYWAIKSTNETGATVYSLVYSTDAISWTAVTTLPAGVTLGLAYGIWALGPGDIVLQYGVNSSIIASANIGYRTTNFGTSWTNYSFTSFAGGCNGGYVKSASASYGLLAAIHGNTTANTGSIYYYNTSGGTWTKQAGISLSTSGIWNSIRNIQGWICAGYNGSTIVATPDTDAGITGTWTSVAAPQLAMYDLVFFNNLWICAGSTGIYTTPNTATLPAVSTPAVASANWTSRSAGATYQFAVGQGKIIAVGASGRLLISTDGLVWYSIPKLNTNAAWNNVVYDGVRNQFVAVSLMNLGPALTAVSPDGVQWKINTITDQGEGTAGNLSMFGLYPATAHNASTGVATLVSVNSTTPCAAMFVGAMVGGVGGTRALALRYNTTGTNATYVFGNPTSSYTLPVVKGSQWHYAEVILKKDPATINNFFLQLRVDGTIIADSLNVSYPMATSTSDTTSFFLVNFPRNGAINGIDDLYIATLDGLGIGQPIGPVKVMPAHPSTDSQAQWAGEVLTVNSPRLLIGAGWSKDQTAPTSRWRIYSGGAGQKIGFITDSTSFVITLQMDFGWGGADIKVNGTTYASITSNDTGDGGGWLNDVTVSGLPSGTKMVEIVSTGTAAKPIVFTQIKLPASSNASVATKAAATEGPSQSGSGLSTSTDGAKDIYNMTPDASITGTFVKGVKIGGYFSNQASSPTVNVGMVSSGVSANGSNVQITTQGFTYVSNVYEKNPNGSVNWTPTTAAAAQATITKVS